MATWVFLHGFGVRGSFWDLGIGELSPGHRAVAPSWDHQDLDSALTALRSLLLAESAEGAVHVVGHSLGGVLGALAAASLGSQTVASVSVVSSPWDEGSRSRFSGLTRFLLSKGWLPGWVIRRRFFGRRIPVKVQKELFGTAVPESPELKGLISRRPWFHVDQLPRPYPHPLLVIGSEADRVVGIRESAAFATALGGRLECIPKAQGWGHDDPAVDPQVARELIRRIEAFISQLT